MSTFKCGKHDFSCESLGELQSHNEQEIHTTDGSAPCNLCGIKTSFSYTGKLARNKFPALCDECKKATLEGLN